MDKYQRRLGNNPDKNYPRIKRVQTSHRDRYPLGVHGGPLLYNQGFYSDVVRNHAIGWPQVLLILMYPTPMIKEDVSANFSYSGPY